MESLNVLQMIQQGWIATYPLIFFSIISLTVIGERLWGLAGIVRNTASLTRAMHADLTRGNRAAALEKAEKDRHRPAGRVFGDVVRQSAAAAPEQLEQLSEERRFEEIDRLKRPLWILGTVSASAPFIGLLGTVIGIIRAFHNMATLGSGGFAVVAGGISEALIATALGLGVAIIALIFYNYFQVRVDRIESALTIGGARILEAMRLAPAEPRLERVADGRR